MLINIQIQKRNANIYRFISLCGEWITLFVIQVFFQIEEGVEEHMRHFAALQVSQRNGITVNGLYHVQHLYNQCIIIINCL